MSGVVFLVYVRSVGKNYIQWYFESFNGQKNYHINFFTGRIIFLKGNMLSLFGWAWRASVILGLKIDFLYKVAIWSSKFCFCLS